MGDTSSKVAIESIITAGISVMNESHNACRTTVTESNVIQCDPSWCEKCGNLIGVVQANHVNIKTNCTFINEFETTIKQCMTEQMSATADTMNDTFFPHGDVKAEVDETMITNLSESIFNCFTNECSTNVAQENAIHWCGDVLEINQSNFTTAMTDCMMDNIASSSAAQAITQTFDAAASATATDPIADLVNGLMDNISLVIVGFIVVAVLVLGGGEMIVTSLATSPAFMGGLVILVIFLVIFFWVIYPKIKPDEEEAVQGDRGERDDNGGGENSNSDDSGNGDGDDSDDENEGQGSSDSDDDNSGRNDNSNNGSGLVQLAENSGDGDEAPSSACDDKDDAVAAERDNNETFYSMPKPFLKHR